MRERTITVAETESFRGYRYRLTDVDDLGRFVAPPYDMIDEGMRESLYAADPLNFVRIIQNRPEPSDESNIERHKRAQKLLSQWLDNGDILHDEQPGVYAYRQRFTVDKSGRAVELERTALTVRVRLVDFATGIVQPHEYTLSGPKTDRYELLRTAKFDTGQIFGIARDDGSYYRAICETVAAAALVGRFTDSNGVVHELLRVSDQALCTRVHATLADRTILIADGHHRYETALRHAHEGGGDGFVMMTVASMADPGLVVRPFHRVVKRNRLSERFDSVRALEPFMDVEDRGEATLEAVYGFLEGEGSFDMVFVDGGDKHLYGLTVNEKGDAHRKEDRESLSDAWNGLNVSKINRFCVREAMGQPTDGTILHDVLDYINDAGKAFKRAISDSTVTGTFFVRPIPIETIRDIVSRGERMPQKSTNFYPKLYSGLVLRSLEST
ncbi:MAG: DUF1015 family protein [Chitinivibrionales bacterium]|nr:DUF1015 family protein [Chitinivibrionales bacterium]MBD3356919.1 DUF1015 family protein [Chitinivibrionales bacterium]